MIILDSSIIVAFFRPLEELHETARKVIETSEHCIIPDHVLAESLTVIKIRKGFEVAKNCSLFLTYNERFTIRPTSLLEFQNTLQFFTGAKNNLSFIDTLLLTLSQQEVIPVATFDQDLRQALM